MCCSPSASAARRQDRCFVYVGGGWYAPGKGIPELQDEMKRHLDAGYTMVKMKVGGAPLDEDMRRIEAVKTHPAAACRACGRCQLQVRPHGSARATPRRWRRTRLRWFEEPCDPLDYATLSEISDAYPHALSTGENLFSTQDVENLVRFGNLKPARRDVIQVDPPQAYGITQYARTLAALEKYQWPRSGHFPHGGNQMSLAIAAGFGLGGAESYPGVFGVFAGFADDAVIENGYISLSDRPGIGFEGQAALYAVMRDLAA